MRIACLHTAASNVAVFDDACAPGVDLTHEVRADLLAAAEAEGGLTPAITGATVAALRALGAKADAVLLTCSTLGPSVDAAALSDMRVLRVDGALAEEAVRSGGKVAVLCAAPTTLEPTRALFEAAARDSGANVKVVLVPGAWDMFKAGRLDEYRATIAAAADRAFDAGADVVALAQASMAGAAPLCRGGVPLTSPRAGLAAAVAAAGQGR